MLHRYAYASGNPINRIDPMGLFDWNTNMVESGDWLACIAREAGRMQPGEYDRSVIMEAINYHNTHRGTDRFVDHPPIELSNPDRLLAGYKLALPPEWQRQMGICSCPASNRRGECDTYTPPLPGEFLPPSDCPPSNVEEEQSPRTSSSYPPVRCADGYTRRGNQCVPPEYSFGSLIQSTSERFSNEVGAAFLDLVVSIIDGFSVLNSTAGAVLTLLGIGLGCGFGGAEGCLAGFLAAYQMWETTDHLNDGAGWVAFLGTVAQDIFAGETHVDTYRNSQTGQLTKVFLVGQDTGNALLFALAGEIPGGAFGEAFVDWNAILYDLGFIDGYAQKLIDAGDPTYLLQNSNGTYIYLQFGE
jgi:hypothetical protein